MLDLQADWVFYLLRPEQLVASNIAVFFDRVIVVCLIKCFLLLQRHNMLILNPLIQICIRLACDFIVWVVGLVTLLEQYSQVALVESISIASRELDLFIKALHFGESVLDKSLGNLSISVSLYKIKCRTIRRIRTEQWIICIIIIILLTNININK